MKWRDYLRCETGAIALGFAIAIPLVIGAAGMSVDVASAYMIKQRLSHAVDAAALAAAASASSEADITDKVKQFFALNYPPNKIGATYDLKVKVNGKDIEVSAQANYKTSFARILGIDTMKIKDSATVTSEIIGLEVAMVLDVTGSMSTNNNIDRLKEAATDFTNILFDNAAYKDTVKIGLIPFSASVNVGPYGLGFLPSPTDYRKPSTTKYDGGTAFVNNPNNYKFDQTNETAWWGCILEQASPNDTKNQTSGTAWKWNMFRWTLSGANDPNLRKYAANYNIPNYTCNPSYILPLTTNRSDILTRINRFVADGNTLSNVGMVWGYRVLSPEAPFREGVAWNNKEWRKVALLMTDGDNNNGEIYNAYGPYTTLKVTDAMLDSKLATTCTNMKNNGITIYTVTFTSAINAATKNFFKSCASSPDKWFDAPTSSDLRKVFGQIARELSNIHLSK